MSKKDKLSVEPYKGVRDFYPEDQAFINYLFSTMRKVVERAGYVEYHASVLEPDELYKSKGAENEEIVNEQSYTFTDRGGACGSTGSSTWTSSVQRARPPTRRLSRSRTG